MTTDSSQEENKVTPSFLAEVEAEVEEKEDFSGIDSSFLNRVIEAFGAKNGAQVARFVGLTPQSVGAWAKGSMPKRQVLLDITKQTGVSLHWLITGEGTKFVVSEDQKNFVLPSQEKGDRLSVLLEYNMGKVAREMAAKAGIDPGDQVALMVWEYMADKGLIRKKLSQEEILIALETEERTIGWKKIRLMGSIAAGKPIQLYHNDEVHWIDAPDIMVPNDDTYALIAKGDSMIGEGVFHNDVVVINPYGTVTQGTTIVAVIGGEEATLKKFYRNGTFASLESANPNYAPIPVPLSKLDIKGVLVGVLRGRGKSYF
ncbi:MAG: helix-turn-helix domain-containing protein [Blastocatellia bacterium]|nr:helix-turn-helix domain-containing protein [Blastocatellia bacterium]